MSEGQTKVGFKSGGAIARAGLSRVHNLASCEESLRRLRTDRIDLHRAHKEGPFTLRRRHVPPVPAE